MTKFIGLIFLVLVAAKGCDKASEDNLDTGIITELDNRDCACCGGWFIDIDNETYRIHNWPENTRLEMNEVKLPLTVELKWEKVENGCMGDEINVSFIRKKEN